MNTQEQKRSGSLRDDVQRLGSAGNENDRDIRSEVLRVLASDAQIDAHDFEVRVENGIVTLKGTIENVDRKQRAEDLIVEIPGVDHVHNELRVGSPETEGFGEQARADFSGNPHLRAGKENPITH